MVKTITKVGNSQGIIFDATIMDIARLKVGDAMSLTIHDSGAITLTPLRADRTSAEIATAISDVMTEYASTMKKLA